MELTLDDSNKLRDVFDVLDNTSSGHIKICDFKKLVNEHFNIETDSEHSQEISTILEVVNNKCGSELNFKEFSDAVKQIVRIKSKESDITEKENDTGIELYEGGGDEEPVQSFQRVASIRRSRRTRPNISSPRHNVPELNNGLDNDIGSPFARSSPRQQSNHSLNSFNKKIVTNSLADSLLAGSEDISQHSTCSDDIFEDIDGNFNELNSKVLSLQSQIEMLSKEQVKSDERNNRQRDENCQLQESRIHILEEQLREVENLSSERFNRDIRSHKEEMKNLSEDKSSEIELLIQNLDKLERKLTISESKVSRLSYENNELKMDIQQADSEIKHYEININKLKVENDDLNNEKTKVNNGFMQKSQMVNELLNKLESRRMSQELDMISSKSMSIEYDNRCIEIDRYDDTLSTMKQEIHELRCERDQLKLNKLQTPDNTMSLADEICNLSKDELISQLKDYQVVSVRLRQHLDWLTLRIIDLCPTILERV